MSNPNDRLQSEQMFVGRGDGGPEEEREPIPPIFQVDLQRAAAASTRYRQSNDPGDLDEAVIAWERILHHPDFFTATGRFALIVQRSAGGSYLRRYQATGMVADLNRALELWQTAVDKSPATSPDQPSHLNNLGGGLRERYERTRDLADLERAIRIWKQAVELSSPNSPDFPGRLNNLGLGLLEHYVHVRNLDDLEQAIQAFSKAVAMTPPDSLDLPMYLSNLGLGLQNRYERREDLTDLNRAIEDYEAAVRQTPPDPFDLPDRLSNLGSGLQTRYTRTGNPADLERALQVYERAVTQSPSGSPNRPSYLNNIGNSLWIRYARTGHLADLERAIQTWELAVAQSLPDSPSLPGYLNNLGAGLRTRYACTGNLADLERALQVHERTVIQSRPDSPYRPLYLDNLGIGLRARYIRTRDPADLEEAIKAHEAAVEQTPFGSADWARYLNNLGAVLWERYDRTENLTDLDRFIDTYEQVVAQTLLGSSTLAGRLNNMSIGLLKRYGRTGDLTDLERAIKSSETAVQHTPSGSPDLPGHLNSLGTGLWERYIRAGNPADLERTLQIKEQVVAMIPPDSPDRPTYLSNLGITLHECYTRTGNPTDLERTIDAWERAWSSLQTTFATSPVVYKIGQQRKWGGLYKALVSAHLQRAMENRPAATAARRRALEIAEGTKSRLLTELVGREELPAPPAVARQAVRERELLTALVALDSVELASYDTSATPQEEVSHIARLQERQQHMRELQNLWAEMAEASPEAADYVALRRGDLPTWDGLTRLATDQGSQTALFSLFTTEDRTLLFILRTGWEAPIVVEADLDKNGWDDILRRFFREVHLYDGSGRRGETWDRPLRPLLEKALVHLEGVERIVFAPEAWGYLLPWSVAARRVGWHDQNGRPVALVTLPALELLPRLQRRPSQREGPALVVGNPLNDLEHAEQEARAVAKLFGTKPLVSIEATKAAVLKDFSDATIIHLATHAFFDPNSPLDSGIILADGILTVREVLEYRLRADLLVLSACQTGMAQSLGGNELAGLAQAFLQAGARSLIASLWAVNDSVTAELMTAFYDARRLGADKAQALSQAMTHVQTEARWTHPYYWGSFVLMGDW